MRASAGAEYVFFRCPKDIDNAPEGLVLLDALARFDVRPPQAIDVGNQAPVPGTDKWTVMQSRLPRQTAHISKQV